MNRNRNKRKMMTFKPTINLRSMVPSTNAKKDLYPTKVSSNEVEMKNVIIKKNKYFGKKGSNTSIDVEKNTDKFKFPAEKADETQNIDINRRGKKRLTRRQKRMMTVQLLSNRKRLSSLNYEPGANEFENKLAVNNKNEESPKDLSTNDKRKMFRSKPRSLTFQEVRKDKKKDLHRSSKLLIIDEE